MPTCRSLFAAVLGAAWVADPWNAPILAAAPQEPAIALGPSPHWVENRGQWPERVEFLARVPGGIAWVERGVIALCSQPAPGERGALVRIVLEGRSESASWEGEEPLEGRYHWYVGDEPTRWVRDARSFGELRCNEVYPGVELVLRFEGRSFKYDLVAEPHAALDHVALRCEGVRAIEVADGGTLRLDTGAGIVEQRAGASWQEDALGQRVPIDTRWRIEAGSTLRFELEGYDPALRLVIDPELEWATYLGGGTGSIQGDTAGGVAIGPDGDAYVVGRSEGYDFPDSSGPFRRAGNPVDCFVTRLRGADGALVYSCTFGASRREESARSVVGDDSGRATVVGYTLGGDFPTTPGALDPHSSNDLSAGFVTQFSPSGDELVFSTYLKGPSGQTIAFDVDLTLDGETVVVGDGGQDFPTTAGSFDPTYNGSGDAFVCALDQKGSRLLWSTFLGGSSLDEAYAVEIDRDRTIVVGGRTNSLDFPTTPGAILEQKMWQSPVGFVSRLTPDGSALVWSTLLAGNVLPEVTVVSDVGLDAFGTTFVAGHTDSEDFPTTPGAFMEDPPWGLEGGTFLCRLSPDATAFLYSTFYGGTTAGGIGYCAVDASGVCTASGAGWTGLPTTPGAHSTTLAGGTDFCVARFAPGGDRLFYATFIGGPASESASSVATTPTGRVTVPGTVDFPGGFPTTPGAPFPDYAGGQSDVAVACLELLLQGVREHGVSTPACLGPVRIGVTEMPAAGSTSFALYASGAPPSTSGFLLLSEGAARIDASIPEPPLYHVDLSRLILRLPVTTDAYGYAERAYPLAADWTGSVIHAQFVFDATPDCPTPSKSCSSYALELTVQ